MLETAIDEASEREKSMVSCLVMKISGLYIRKLFCELLVLYTLTDRMGAKPFNTSPGGSATTAVLDVASGLVGVAVGVEEPQPATTKAKEDATMVPRIHRLIRIREATSRNHRARIRAQGSGVGLPLSLRCSTD